MNLREPLRPDTDIDIACREIPLTKGLVAIVDADLFDWLSQWKWCASDGGRGKFYASARCGQMHRLLLNFPLGLVVDHINGDGLDNRLLNLRPVTPIQNSYNRRGKLNGTGFKGVYARKGRFIAQIDSPRTHIGMFDTAEEAARAYDAVALARYGEFAWTNFPQDPRTLEHAGAS